MSDGASSERGKRPASQYYWGDWWKDKGLHSCSLAARGLWHEMNCLMHEGEPYGHLTLNGKPMTVPQIANQSRITTTLCSRLMTELLAAGVPGVDQGTGAWFSRRMVRDERIREARAAGGKAGAEHGVKGAEYGKKGGRPTTPKGGSETPLGGGEKPPPSSSSSTASSPSEDTPPKPPRKRGARGQRICPEDFAVTGEMVLWAQAEAPGVNLERETTKFRNHEFTNPKTDWVKTWKNWMLRACERGGSSPDVIPATKQSAADRRAETMAGLTGRTPERNPNAERDAGVVDVDARIVG